MKAPMGEVCSLHVARLVLKLHIGLARPFGREARRKMESARMQEEMSPLCSGVGKGEATCEILLNFCALICIVYVWALPHHPEVNL